MTICQVRTAVCAWLAAILLPDLIRQRAVERVAESIQRTQTRNAAAIHSHTKARRRKLREIGIRVERLRSCVPP